jgi:GGDEF domain-containing protein
MDPVTLVVTALAVGGAEGLKETATKTIKDAYAALRSLVGRRLASRQGAEAVLDRYEGEPAVWEAPLISELSSADVATDNEILRAAQRLLALVDQKNAAKGKFDTHIEGDVKGFVQGDFNRVGMTFGTEAGASDVVL